MQKMIDILRRINPVLWSADLEGATLSGRGLAVLSLYDRPINFPWPSEA